MRDIFSKSAMNSSLAEKTRQLLSSTATEAVLGAVMLGAVFGSVSYNTESKKEGQIPIAFSEVGKTIKAFENDGKQVPPLTRFYSRTNDVLMKAFEANNIALSANRSNSTFASELEYKMERTFKVHRLISEDVAVIPNDARESLQSLQKLAEATNELPAVNSEFSAAWDKHHHDVTHTEYDRSCDDKGSCTTTSREVYDYTVHTYTYHPEHGARASQALETFLKKHPDLNIEERLELAKKTDPDNEYAIEQSMKELLKGQIPSPAEALRLANTWATGSNFTTFLPVITSNHANLTKISPVWNAAMKSAKSDRYITYSHSDSGPKEYQVAETALQYGTTIDSSARKIVGGIQSASQNIPALERKIKEYIDVELNKKPGNAAKLRDETMQLARTVYQQNFESGFDVEPFKWGNVALFALLGMLAGGLGGEGVRRGRILLKKRETLSP